jgi:hypothetical protein
MKNLLPRASMADIEPGPPVCGHLEPRPAEDRIHIEPRFRAAISDGEFRDVLQNGDVR